MKRNRILMLGLLALFMAGCTNTDPETESSSAIESSQASSQSSSQASSSSSESEAESESEVAEATIEAYFPFDENVAYSYLGEGNEFVSYERYPQYAKDNRIQYVTKNGGTNFVEVLEFADGAITRVFRRDETYFRENMLDKTSDNAGNIILKEPLTVGNKWSNPAGSESEITAVDVEIAANVGTYPTIEVTTTENDTITKRYYAEGIGLVKEIFTDTAGSYEMTATLEARNEGAPEAVVIRTFYPDANVMGLEYSDVNAAFSTNDVTRETMTDLFKQVPGVEYGRLIPDTATIKSMYLNDDGRVYVDFSQELVTDLNAGSSGESLILQGIVNTIATYYGVEEVVLTVEGAPYESGHYSMREGESFKLDMEDVAE